MNRPNMTFYAYVIYSDSCKKFYKGHCQDLDKRLKEHNQGKTKSIKAYTPFRFIYVEKFNTREEAILRERYFKSAAGRRFLKKHLIIKSA